MRLRFGFLASAQTPSTLATATISMPATAHITRHVRARACGCRRVADKSLRSSISSAARTHAITRGLAMHFAARTTANPSALQNELHYNFFRPRFDQRITRYERLAAAASPSSSPPRSHAPRAGGHRYGSSPRYLLVNLIVAYFAAPTPPSPLSPRRTHPSSSLYICASAVSRCDGSSVTISRPAASP